MTIDEALDLIKHSAECFVVWRTDTGEIVSVANLDESATADDRIAHLSQMTKAAEPNVQYAGRFLQSTSVMRATLEQSGTNFYKTMHV